VIYSNICATVQPYIYNNTPLHKKGKKNPNKRYVNEKALSALYLLLNTKLII
jgi:hypothetical protein